MTYEQQIKYYQKQKEKKLRELLRRDYGNRNYRITRDNEVHVYGKMPNSTVVGWWFLGHIAWVELDYQI